MNYRHEFEEERCPKFEIWMQTLLIADSSDRFIQKPDSCITIACIGTTG